MGDTPTTTIHGPIWFGCIECVETLRVGMRAGDITACPHTLMSGGADATSLGTLVAAEQARADRVVWKRATPPGDTT